MTRLTPRHLTRRSGRLVADTLPAMARARWHLRGAEVGRNARIIGRPLITTPDLHIGDDLTLWSHYRTTHLGGTGRLVIGDRVTVNVGAVVLAFSTIEIGDDAGLATDVFVSDSDNHPVGDRSMRESPVRIGEGAWISTRAMVLAGVTVGARAVVAAGAVVVSDVPDDTLVAGVPARVVRRITYPPGRKSAWKE